MQLAMIGLGRMGGNMVRRLMSAGHEVIVYSATAKTRESFAKETGVLAAVLDRTTLCQAKAATCDLADGAGGRVDKTFGRSCAPACSRRTSSSTAATRITSTTSAAPKNSLRREFTMSTSAPAAEFGDWSAVTA